MKQIYSYIYVCDFCHGICVLISWFGRRTARMFSRDGSKASTQMVGCVFQRWPSNHLYSIFRNGMKMKQNPSVEMDFSYLANSQQKNMWGSTSAYACCTHRVVICTSTLYNDYIYSTCFQFLALITLIIPCPSISKKRQVNNQQFFKRDIYVYIMKDHYYSSLQEDAQLSLVCFASCASLSAYKQF